MQQPRTIDISNPIWTYAEVRNILTDPKTEPLLEEWAWDWLDDSVRPIVRMCHCYGDGSDLDDETDPLEALLNSDVKRLNKTGLSLLSKIGSQKAFRPVQAYFEATDDPEFVFHHAGGLLAGYGNEEAQAFLTNHRCESPTQLATWWSLSPEECARVYQSQEPSHWFETGRIGEFYQTNIPTVSNHVVEALSAQEPEDIETSIDNLLTTLGGGLEAIDSNEDQWCFEDQPARIFGFEAPLEDDDDLTRLWRLICKQQWQETATEALSVVRQSPDEMSYPLEGERKQLSGLAEAFQNSISKYPGQLAAKISFSLCVTGKRLLTADRLLFRHDRLDHSLRALDFVRGEPQVKVAVIILQQRESIIQRDRLKRWFDRQVRRWIFRSIRQQRGNGHWFAHLEGLELMPTLIELAKVEEDISRSELETTVGQTIRAHGRALNRPLIDELMDINPTLQRGIIRALARENCSWAARAIADRWDEFDRITRSLASDALYQLASSAPFEKMKRSFPAEPKSWDTKAMERVKLATREN